MTNVWKLSTNENNKLFDIFLGQCIILSETLEHVRESMHKELNVNVDEVYHLSILNPSINTQQCTLVEKIIYDFANFHLKRLNLNIEDFFIEFWEQYSIERDVNQALHFDKDEHYNNVIGNEPLFTILTYLTDSEISTLITPLEKENVDNDTYQNKNNIIISQGEYFKQITFDGGKYYHGRYNHNVNTDRKRLILGINIFKKQPTHDMFFSKDLYLKCVESYLRKNEINEYLRSTLYMDSSEIQNVVWNFENVDIEKVSIKKDVFSFSHDFWHNLCKKNEKNEKNEKVIPDFFWNVIKRSKQSTVLFESEFK